MHYDEGHDNDICEINQIVDMQHLDEMFENIDLVLLVFVKFDLQLIMYIVDIQDENEQEFIYVVILVHHLDDEVVELLEMLVIQNDDNE